MRSCFSLTALALAAGLSLNSGVAMAQADATAADGGVTKVLASGGAGFNVAAVQDLINRGDAAVAAGNLPEARKDYDNARSAAKQLLAFYRDLSGAFPEKWMRRGGPLWGFWRKRISASLPCSGVRTSRRWRCPCWWKWFV
jgi:hypothetical protein